MQKIMLTLLFCSVVIMANNEQKNDNEREGILTKTLKEVQTFKKEKNQEIEALRVQVSLLKNKLNSLKKKQRKEIKKVRLKLKVSQQKVLKYKKTQIKLNSQKQQKKEIKLLKNKLIVIENKVLKYKKAQIKANKKLKDDKKIIKDLHFMIKQKNEVEMDQYALGRYYFNL